MIKSQLLDGQSGIPELSEFISTVPNFRSHVIGCEDTIDVVITKLYESSMCHHAYPNNWNDIDTNDRQFKDFLHTVLITAKHKTDRIEMLYADLY